MPSLLKKLSYFDPETGRQFVQAADGFYWKEGKKSPEDSKVTKMLAEYGWQLTNGNDVWLIFKKKGNPGELFVIRGEKRWYLDMPDDQPYESAAEGQGLDSLQQAILRGKLDKPKAMAMHASPAATAVNNAGNGHSEVEGELRPDARVAREVMHDDSGAQTGLRSRPDYGESDSFTSKMNDANSKAAFVLALSGTKVASGEKADLYVSGVSYQKRDPFKLSSFSYTADHDKALVLPRHTAVNLAAQIIRLHGTKVRLAAPKQADEHTLNGFTIESLEDFVGHSAEKAAAAPAVTPEIDRSQPATLNVLNDKPKKEEKKDDDFGLGAQYRDLSDEEMREYMDRVKKKEKSKTDKYNYPIVHGGNIKFVDDTNKEYDVEWLKKQITQKPGALLKKNEKMQHSDGTKTQFYNIGLPALKGLALNEKTGKFVIVDTCPGAGACKTMCYAMRGNYVRVPQPSLNQSKVLNFLVNHPDKFAARLKAEIGVAVTDVDPDEKVIIRWHDAGDFFSPEYMNMAFDVARAFPDVQFYAYTKVAAVANAKKPENFIINFSEGALPSETKKVDLTQIKKSVIVPQKMFWDLIVTKGAHTVRNEKGQVQFKNEKTWDEFKDRLAQTYQAPKDAIIIYDDYMEMKANGELGDKPKWNVVVPPGAGDQAANDPLVLVSFLMWH